VNPGSPVAVTANRGAAADDSVHGPNVKAGSVAPPNFSVDTLSSVHRAGLAASTFKHGAIRTSKAFQASPLWLKAPVSLRGLLFNNGDASPELIAKKFVSAEESVNHGRMCVAEVFLGIIPHTWARRLGGTTSDSAAGEERAAIIAPARPNFEESFATR